MSHPQQLEFINTVKTKVPQFFDNQTVLEIGSLNINGSIRPFFTNCRYLGIDVGPGKDVDLISKGEEYAADDNFFDVTVSCECFEHNPEWVRTFQNMIRMTKSGGLVMMTCATAGRPEHGTARTSPADSPLTIGLGWNYYQNIVEDDFRQHFDFDALFSQYNFVHNLFSHDLYFWGIKK
jgi:SAM-dependent methyltransferase